MDANTIAPRLILHRCVPLQVLNSHQLSLSKSTFVIIISLFMYRNTLCTRLRYLPLSPMRDIVARRTIPSKLAFRTYISSFMDGNT